jgi:histidinol-phosphate aminotransferase
LSISPKAPSKAWLESYLDESLVSAKAYAIDTPDVTVKLDQNESPWDWTDELKDIVLDKVKKENWNRYPSAYSDDLCDMVANYVGVKGENILLSPGSNYLCTLLLSTYSKQMTGKVIIAAPSFPLYEGHCKYDNIPYERWNLNDDLEYDVSLLPEVTSGSIIIFASPNNPVGNVLPKKTLVELMTKYPDSLFMADEAYFEYASEPYTDLLNDFGNLILIRTFSKTLGSAGLRLGYLVAAKEHIEHIKKLRLPFMLNHFTMAAAETILTNEKAQSVLQKVISESLSERKRVFDHLSKISDKGEFTPKTSEANFIMIRFHSNEKAQLVYNGLVEANILVRNISKGPGLAGCLRVTIGNKEENSLFLNAMDALV